MQDHSFNLNTPLLTFTDAKGTFSWTIGDAVQGVQIFGNNGSGKTSGSGRALALNYLSHGFGGLVLTVKADEADLWRGYCAATGRLDDLVIIEPGGAHSFNVLEYISSKQGADIPLTRNIMEMISSVVKAGKDHTGFNDNFFEDALDMLIYNIIDLCQLAYGKISIRDMYEIAQSIPVRQPDQSREPETKEKRNSAFDKAFELAQENVNKQIAAWEAGQTRKRTETPEEFEQAVCDALPDAALLKFIDQFFVESYRNLSSRTRSIIDFSFTGFLFHLLKEPVHSLFFQKPSTITPDDCMNGKILLINLPVKLYQRVGKDAQIMCKFICQKSWERRNVAENGRPVFLWADEAQYFIHEHDTACQATARSAKIITTYLSQNLPNYFANMFGAKSEHLIKSFLGTLGTKIFHAGDLDTNKYASELIGDAYTEDHTSSSTLSGQFSSTQGKSFKLERMVRPEEFSSLRTGSPRNNLIVEAYVHLQSAVFSDGKNFKKVKFRQDYSITKKQ
jgi:hypothetical protein